MKSSELSLPGYYIAKVSGALTVVYVGSLPVKYMEPNYYGSVTRYSTFGAATNVATGKRVNIKTGARLRRKATEAEIDDAKYQYRRKHSRC
jgi:hypothetical protein